MSATALDRRSRKHIDWILIAMVYAVSIFGIYAIAIATYSPDTDMESTLLNYIISSTNSMWQAVFVLASPIVLVIITKSIPYHFLKRNAMAIYFFTIPVLAVVLGTKQINGISAWFRVGAGRSFQPSEVAKVAMIVTFAKLLSSNEKPMGNMRSFWKLILFFAVPAVLIIMQPDVGTFLVFVFMFFVMLWFAGVDWKVIVGIVLAAALLAGLLFLAASLSGSDSYRVQRILSFLDPSTGELDSAYQQTNAKRAIGAGGLFGIGQFIEGSYSQLDFVPEDWTDFIFSSIGEAFGFVGSAGLILMYLLIIIRLVYLSRYTPDKFGQLIIIGVASILLFHVMENVGMNIGLLPITGIPLPFVSYGGSNYMTNMAGIGLVLNVVNNRSQVDIEESSQASRKKTRRMTLR
jgi:rod shape determining protein RodA